MTPSLNLANICNAIAGLSISGVTVKDVDELAESWTTEPNILYPNVNPPGFVTEFGVEAEQYVDGTIGLNSVHYTLNYRFLGTDLGENLKTGYLNVVNKLTLIVQAILAAPRPYSEDVEMELGNITIGPVADPAGHQFHGADFALKIVEQKL